MSVVHYPLLLLYENMFLTRDWLAKILAVVCAIGFWVYVVSVGEKIRMFPDPVIVQTFNVPESAVIVNENNLGAVQISVLALDEDFAKLKKDDLVAYIDVAGIEMGTEREVPVKVTLNNPNVKLYAVDPPKLTVRVDKVTSNQFNVETESEGSIAAGYSLGVLEASDKRIRIEGPQSRVQQISRVVARLKLNGDETDDIERQVQLTALNAAGEAVADVTLVPASVSVRAAVEQVTYTKTVGVVVDLSDASPAAGQWIKEVTVTPSSVQVQGDPAALARLVSLQTSEIDIAGLDRNLTTTTPLVLPSGITMAPGSSRQVTVTVTLSSEATTRDVFAAVQVINIPANLMLSKVDPGSIKVTISGPLPVMSNIADSSVILTIDASSADIGTKRYSVAETAVTVPGGVTIDSYSPREVRITFDEAVVDAPDTSIPTE